MLPDLPNLECWRFYRVRRGLGLLRLALVGVFAAVLIHALGI